MAYLIITCPEDPDLAPEENKGILERCGIRIDDYMEIMRVAFGEYNGEDLQLITQFLTANGFKVDQAKQGPLPVASNSREADESTTLNSNGYHEAYGRAIFGSP